MKPSLLLACTLFTAAILPAAEKPNIIFILADDLGYRELGCYGQEKIKTPRIDALAATGMKFTRAYSGNAVCAPSRCVLMTGKHPGHATVRDNASVEPEGQHPLFATDVTIAERLKAQGYACGAFGKWGLGNTWSDGNPNRQGFDRFFGYNCQAHAHSYYPATLWSDGELFPLKNDPPVPGHEGLAPGADPNDPRSYDRFKGQDYAPDRIHEQALKFLRENRDGPFFLYYPNVIPHVALHIPDAELEPYLAMQWNDPPFTRPKGGYTPHFTPRAAYAAMISKLDTQVGEVVDLVSELGQTENTIIIFTSDNGATHLKDEVDYEFFQSVGELRGLKGELYEGGIRVPQIAAWPGKIPAGTTSDRVTGFEDWTPTLLELAGLPVPAPGEIDGISLAATLSGEKQEPRPFLYREFPSYGGQQAVWLGQRWKGIRTNLKKKGVKPDLTVQLYDLEADPSEKEDVAAANPEVVKEIEALMKSERVVSEAFPFPALDE
ncbi:MAG: arylsulfatase [Verrucomicrobiales bacterium]|nr:arylsulfatase [Verrucomicrobiales bacterium]